jgi:hypothetical protein
MIKEFYSQETMISNILQKEFFTVLIKKSKYVSSPIRTAFCQDIRTFPSRVYIPEVYSVEATNGIRHVHTITSD